MKRGGIDDIAAIDGEHNLKTKIAPFPHHNGITAAFFANNQARQHSSPLVAQLNRHQRRG